MTVCGHKVDGVCVMGKCEHFNRCCEKYVYVMTSEPMTNEENLRSCSTEDLAGAIYEWYSLGFTRGKNGKKLNSVTEVVEWLKQPHNSPK